MPLSLAEARTYIDKCMQKATQLNVRVSLAVVDEFGQLIQVDRMDGASLMSPDIAEAKAITALNFKRSTGGVARDYQADPEGLKSIQQAVHFKIMAAPGGVPIFRESDLVGAIGVDGGIAEQDEEVANHGASE